MILAHVTVARNTKNAEVDKPMPGTIKNYSVSLLVLISQAFLMFANGVAAPADTSAFSYVMGTEYFAQSNIPQPAQWESYVDPNTGISIRRITDIHKDYPQMPAQYGATIDYPRKSRSSSDGRYVLVYTAGTGSNRYKIVDLQAQTIRDAPHISTSIYDRNGGQDAQPEYRWDYTGEHPNRIYYRYGWEFYYGEVDYPDGQANSPTYNVLIHNFRKDTATLGKSAASIQNVYNDTEGDSDAESRYWCWQVRLSDGERRWVIVYDKSTDKIIGKLENNNESINFTDMAPDGSKAFVSYNYIDTKAFDLDMTNPINICANSSHSGWAFSPDGIAEFVQINNCGGDYIRFKSILTGQTNYLPFHQCYFANTSNGYLWNRCSTPEYLGHHIARVYPNIRGWAIFSIYDEANNYWGSNQIIAVELKNAADNPRIWRIASTQNFRGVNPPGPGGSTAPEIALSKDGTKIYFGSNWRGTDNFEVYEATLPDNWWLHLQQQMK